MDAKKKKKIIKKHLWDIIALVILLYIVIMIINFATIPASGRTNAKMLMIGKHIADYMQEHENLPDNIDDIIKNKKDLKDAWGNKIIYSKIDDNTFLLTSYGKDKKKGGTKSNDDIVKEMKPVYDSNGVINFYAPYP